MNASRIAVAFAIVTLGGAAHAQTSHASPIPANYVDDFGPVTSSSSAPALAAVTPSHASPIPANYVDDFGPTTSERGAGREELGAAGAEPGRMAAAAEQRAAYDVYHREQALRSIWAPNP